MAKIAKTADRKKIMDTTKSTDCPKCGKPTRIVKRVKARERNVGGGVFISCSVCEFFEKLYPPLRLHYFFFFGDCGDASALRSGAGPSAGLVSAACVCAGSLSACASNRLNCHT